MARKVRWGHVHELRSIPRVTVGAAGGMQKLAAGFKRAPHRLKHLSAWRRMHMLGSHASIRTYARIHGMKPSSNLKIQGSPSKLRYIAQKTSG